MATKQGTATRGGKSWYRNDAVTPGAATGFFLVALAAATWGTDLFFRVKLALELPAAAVVFAEHLILVLVTAPLLVRALRAARSFDRRDWLAILFVGAGASALATILFTAGLSQGDAPSVYLLQQLQPLVAALGARWLLGERLHPRYWLFFVLAVSGAYLVNFPDPLSADPRSIAGGAFALGAAILWASGTVFGRHLTTRLPFEQLTALRFGIGLPAAALILLLTAGIGGFTSYPASAGPPLVTIALVPGLLAMLIYYRGLRATPAAAATIAELVLPVSILLISTMVFHFSLTGTQWAGVACLTGTITVMGLASRRDSGAVGIEAERQPRLAATSA
ncbi:DMT family transporter [soil metagenome]